MSDPRPQAAEGLVAALLRPECYPHPVEVIRLEETHISWVLLTGEWAYKVKKPVNLGFLDFSTLAARRRFCEEELRLNRRFASGIYTGVVAIRGSVDSPRVGPGDGPVIDYAVRMREFEQDALASRMLDRGALGPEEIDGLADAIAAFHESAAAASPDEPYGTPAAVSAPMQENFEQIRAAVPDAHETQALALLERWTETELRRIEPLIAERRDAGRVRECHGDLHLGNVVRIGGTLVPFDCLEFSPELRWIDVMSEIAFLAMDLTHRGRPDLSHRIVNRYLEMTGDYTGIGVLRYYCVYRALVRAKVEGIRAAQAEARAPALARYRSYVALASAYTRRRAPAIVITYGLSGSGKTTASQALLEATGAIRFRSDVERKRLHGLSPLASSTAAPGAGIYDARSTAATYARLEHLARFCVEAGFTAIVDAAFLKRAERDAFRRLAKALGVTFSILACDAPMETLRQRVAARAKSGKDASEADLAVLELQRSTVEAVADEEEQDTVRVAEASGPAILELARRLHLTDAASGR